MEEALAQYGLVSFHTDLGKSEEQEIVRHENPIKGGPKMNISLVKSRQ